MTETHKSDSAALIEAISQLTITGSLPIPLNPESILSLFVPPGHDHKIIDLERLLNMPRRERGTVNVHDVAALAGYVAPRLVVPETSAFYGDVDKTSITAVLNDQGGWGDHRAVLTLRHTPEWVRWTQADKNWLAQREFAEHIEESQADIRNPPAADMLELAQTLQATTSVAFKSSQLLHNGQRQFKYEETLDATAGRQGALIIPATFTLGLIPFRGMAEPYKLEARLQYRIEDGHLKLRYLLSRPHLVVDEAFGDVCSQVQESTGMQVLRAAAPAPISPIG